MSNTIKAIIWDLDGVIIDSADEHRRAWQRLAREEKVKFTDEDFWATFGKRNNDIFAIVWGPLTPEQAQELGKRKETYFRDLIRQTATPLPASQPSSQAKPFHWANQPPTSSSKPPRHYTSSPRIVSSSKTRSQESKPPTLPACAVSP